MLVSLYNILSSTRSWKGLKIKQAYRAMVAHQILSYSSRHKIFNVDGRTFIPTCSALFFFFHSFISLLFFILSPFLFLLYFFFVDAPQNTLAYQKAVCFPTSIAFDESGGNKRPICLVLWPAVAIGFACHAARLPNRFVFP